MVSKHFKVLSRGLPLRVEKQEIPLPLRVWIDRPQRLTVKRGN